LSLFPVKDLAVKSCEEMNEYIQYFYNAAPDAGTSTGTTSGTGHSIFGNKPPVTNRVWSEAGLDAL
jgi:hypothetical protein